MSPQQHRAMEALQYRSYYGLSGLGDARPITSAIGSGLMAAAGVVAAVGGPAGVVAGAIMAAVGALTSLIGGLFAPDLTKVQATHIVDQIEAQALKPLRAAWNALPPEHKTQSMQAEFLTTFDQAMAAMTQACSNPALGTAGQNCISDRVAGACHWTVDGHTPGQPPNCGNWVIWYRDPIANDPNVIPDPVAGSTFAGGSSGSVSGAVDSAVSSVSQALGGINPVWIGVGLIAAVLLLVGD